MSRHSPIAATARSLQLLEILAGNPGLSVAVLSRRMGLASPHVWKILVGLQSAGYVRKAPLTNVYLLTYKIVALSARHTSAVRVIDLCQPFLETLAARTGELIELSLLDGEVLRCVAKADGTELVTVRSLLGTEVDLHATASGKAWLSSLPEDRALALARARGLRRFTPKTITSLAGLRAALRSAKRLGYAVVEEEHLEGAHGVGVPVVPPGGTEGVGSLVAAGPPFRFRPTRLRKLVPILKATAREVAAVVSDTNARNS